MSAPALRKLGASRPAAVSTYWAQQHAAALQRAQSAPSTVEEPNKEVARDDRPQHKPRYSFKMHVGADLDIFTRDAAWYPQPEAVPERSADPFAELPLRNLAERLGEHFQPVAKAIQEEHERGRGAARKQFAAQAAGPDDIRIPSLLPITKWTAENATIRNTLIADDPKTRKRARLSWYHPEDTMVPRDWFSKGLLADLEYYNPFGLGTR